MPNFRLLFRSPLFVGLIVSLFALVVYLKTLAPSVTFIDSGELATVACTLGIAHPTGYPLFTLIGWVFSKLPVAAEQITRLNIMASVFCAAGIFVFFQLVHLLLVLASKPKAGASALIASAGASFLLAFSETYWSQATSVEVYSLHVFFVSLLLFCFAKANFFGEIHDVDYGRTGSETNWWMIFAFVLGLSFTNHMTTILLAPGLIYLYFSEQGGRRQSWMRIARMTVPFILGLSVYVYLPVRATGGAILNWGNPVTLERFIWHLSGKQFRVWIFSSTEAAGRQLKYFVNALPHEFAYIGLILALLGAVVLFRVRRKLAIGILLLFISCVLYSINYDIHDIDSYFLLAYFCVALLSAFAILQIQSWARSLKPVQQSVISALILCGSLSSLPVHYAANDESSNYMVEDYTENMFASIKPNALVLSFQWDYWVSAAYYFQIVKGFRTDVAVVDKELLRRSWYFLQLERRFPWLIQNSQSEINAYLKELYKFEHELPYNPAIIQERYVEMIHSLIAKNINFRPVYVTPEIEPEFTDGYQRIPEGLAFQLSLDSGFHGTTHPRYRVRPFQRTGRLEDVVKNMYLSSLNARVIYYYKNGFPSEADSISPDAREIAEKLGHVPLFP